MFGARHLIRGATRTALRGRRPVGVVRRRLAARCRSLRSFSSSSSSSSSFRAAGGAGLLHARMTELVPGMRADMAALKKDYGNADLGSIKVSQVLGGMRGMVGLLTETSLLDAEEGIRFRGYSIEQLQEKLPRAASSGGEEPLPEGLLWLLLTGELPTDAQVEDLSADLKARAALPSWVESSLDALPREMHPMSQLVSAAAMLQTGSKFARAYAEGTMNKKTMWEPTLDDSLDLIARLPAVAARIYRNVFHKGQHIASDPSLDLGANLAHMMGFGGKHQVTELMRLYLTLHADHEGGNVSAHACRVVGSALADPYLSYAASMAGLAGPLHGLANQEVLRWLISFKAKLDAEGAEITPDAIRQACWDTLNSGQVIPGFGHAVLRKTDPRYTCQRGFALKHLPDDPLFKVVSMLYEVVPGVLTEHGKTANPWPNVDAHSGVLLSHYGLTEANFYTVLFGVSRGIGVLASQTVDRIVGMPIERPKSVTSQWIRENCKKE